MSAWTCDELYGRDGKFLDGMEEREQAFVAEIPANFHGWLRDPTKRRCSSCEVQNLVKYSGIFHKKSWQRYRIKDTDKGPAVWDVIWIEFWRKGKNDKPVRQCLIIARNVLTSEWKYFVSNRIPGQPRVTVRWLLRVAFGRWSIESCFRETKEELGLDHFEVRGWRCIHRHYFVTQLSHLFCARVRQEFARNEDPEQRLTIEQVRSATNVYLSSLDLSLNKRKERCEQELAKQQYHQRRNQQARISHWKTRIKKLEAIGIQVEKIKSCIVPPNERPPNDLR